MIRSRIWWGVAVVVTVLLWAAVLAIPAISLLLPNQYQGTSQTVPVDIIVRDALERIAPSLALAATAMLVVLVVAAVLSRPASARRPKAEPIRDDIVEGELIEQGRDAQAARRDAR